MQITESQYFLAHDLLSLLKRLSGERFDEEDVWRLARGIARHSWVDKQLNDLYQAHTKHPQPFTP